MTVADTDSSIERLTEIVSGGRRFVFSRPLEVEISCPDDVWEVRASGLGLDSFGVSRREAMEHFGLLIANAWDSYVNAGRPGSFTRVRRIADALRAQISEVVDAR